MCGSWSSLDEDAMTLEELENTLPNGFHDAAIKSLSIDYEKSVMSMELSLCVGLPDDPAPQRDAVRDARISISGIAFVTIDPPEPDADYNFISPREITIVSTFATGAIPGRKIVNQKLLDRLPSGTFAFSLFVINWNSYMHIAAKNCSVVWLGEVQNYQGLRQHFYPGEII
jgi:hypothetical protein